MSTSIRIVPCTPDEVFVPVDPSSFIDGLRIPFDVYAKDRNIIKFLFSKNTVFCDIAREILAMQSLTEFFIRERDLADYHAFRKMARAIHEDRGRRMLFEDYSYHKEQSFVLKRDFITADVATKLRIGILKYPTFGEIPLIEDLAGESIVKKIKDLDYDIVIPLSKLQAYETDLLGLKGNPSFEEHLVMRELLKIKTQRLFSDVTNDAYLDDLIEATTEMAQFIIDNKHLVVQMTSSYLYDFYLYVHSVNVMLLSVVLGSNLGIPRDEITPLAIGAILHDIGKTAIANDLLDKTGNLSNEEQSIYQGYALRSVEILQGMKKVPAEAVEIAKFHEEKLSGSGLKANKGPLFARIVELTNAYDTMVSNKVKSPKKKAFEALDVLKQEKDHYDQMVMKTFIGIFA